MKTPNTESELGIIGCCLAGGTDTALDAVELVKSSDFTMESCKAAFGVIESLTVDGKDVSLATFMQGWRATYHFDIPIEILSSSDNIPSAAALKIFASQVSDSSRRRNLLRAAQLIVSKAEDYTKETDALIAEAEEMLIGQDVKGFPIYTGKQCAGAFVEDLEYRAKLSEAGQKSGIATGFYDLDRMTDGLQLSEQAIIGARPSIGKTAIGLNVVKRACLINSVPTVVISLEMRREAVMRRMAADWCSIDMNSLKNGSLTSRQFNDLAMFHVKVNASPLYVINGIAGMDCNRIASVVRRAVRKHGVKLVVIDYLQKVQASTKQEKRTYEVGQVSTALKNCADSTKTAFLTLAQLSRESDKEKGRLPKLTDLADSAQIERDGDMIALLHRSRTEQDPEGTQATLTVAKQRDGEVGQIKLHYNGKHCRFSNPENYSHHP